MRERPWILRVRYAMSKGAACESERARVNEYIARHQRSTFTTAWGKCADESWMEWLLDHLDLCNHGLEGPIITRATAKVIVTSVNRRKSRSWGRRARSLDDLCFCDLRPDDIRKLFSAARVERVLREKVPLVNKKKKKLGRGPSPSPSPSNVSGAGAG